MPPTNGELASIAATIATGKEVTEDDFFHLAERALAIWWGAALALKDCKDRGEFADRVRIREEYKNPPLNPFLRRHEDSFAKAGLEPPRPSYDYTFKKALSDVMPKKSQTDRVKFFRDYLKWLCEFDPSSLASLSTVAIGKNAAEIPALTNLDADSAMTSFRERGFTYDQFCHLAEHFLPWLENCTSRKRAEAGRVGGKARSAKGRVKPAKK